MSPEKTLHVHLPAYTMAYNDNPVGYSCSLVGLNYNGLDYGNSNQVEIYWAAIVQLEPKCQEWRATQVLWESLCACWWVKLEEYNSSPWLHWHSQELTYWIWQVDFSRPLIPKPKTYVGRGVCKDQNIAQMCPYLSHSLKEKATQRLKSQSSSYRIGSEGLTDGPSYLKLVIQKCTTASQSMVATIRNLMIALPEYIKLVEGDIEKFNDFVWVLQVSLLQCGEQCPDLLLVNIYSLSIVQQFRRLISKSKWNYNTHFTLMGR